jgi:ABC-type glycerol-3-phosphate transport system substrate-binding protein
MKRSISRRQLLKATAIGGTGALLAACGGATPTPQIVEVTKEVQVTTQVEVTKEVQVTQQVEVTAAPVVGPQTLTVWGSGLDLKQITADPTGATAGSGGVVQKTMQDLFISKHPNDKLVWEDHGWDETLRQNVVSALLAGTSPDVIVGENFFQQYAALNALLPLDDAIPPAVSSNAILGTHKAALYNGKTYGLSWLSGCFGFEINPDVMKEAGVDAKVPATWDDLLASSKAITEKGGGKYAGFSVGGMFRLAVLFQQLGVTLNKADAFDQPNFNDPNGAPVWEFVRKILPYTPSGLVFEPDEGKVYTQLYAGKSAQQIAGSWHVSWAKTNKFMDAQYGAVPIPTGGKPASYVVGNVIFGAMAVTKVPELAKDWIVLSQDDSVQKVMYASAGRLPATKTAMEALLADSKVEDATKTFGKLLRDSDLGILPQWTKNPNQLNSAWNDLFTAVLTTQTDVKQLMDDAQKKADDAMKA